MSKKKIINIFKDTDPLWKYVRGTGNWTSIVDTDDYDAWTTNLSGEEVDELGTELEAYLAEAVEFAKAEGKDVQHIANEFYKTAQDGTKYIKFKRKKYDEDTEGPKVYNITGEEITGQVKKDPGGGSTLRVRAMIKPYFMASTKTVGLSFGMLAVQIIENKEYVGASGFGDESSGETPPFEVASESEDY